MNNLILSPYKDLHGKKVKVFCTDGDVIEGYWVDWCPPDEDPAGRECTIIDRTDDRSGYVAVYADEIKDIQEAHN